MPKTDEEAAQAEVFLRGYRAGLKQAMLQSAGEVREAHQAEQVAQQRQPTDAAGRRMTMRDCIVNALQQQKKPLPLREIVKHVAEQGYRSSARNFGDVVSQALVTMRKEKLVTFDKNNRVYALK